MKKQIAQIQIAGAILWAAAMIAAAIAHAPSFFTLGLLPLLATSFMSAVEIIGWHAKRQSSMGPEGCGLPRI